MKIQIIKIIPCLLAGFILSACVGSVSVPADDMKKMDDPETQKMVEVETETMVEPKIPPPNPCIANPFGDGCNDYGQQSFCGIRANAGDSRCATILGRTNMATWLQSYIIPLPATAVGASNGTSFLRISADSMVDTTGVTINFTDGKPRTLTRDGDSNDGVLYYKATPNGSNTEHFFAGILPTTDLGLPVPQNEPDATWTGSYRRGNTAIVNDVSFDIDFENRTINASAPFAESNDFNPSNLNTLRTRSAVSGGYSKLITFNLNFTPSGVIEGTASMSFGEVVDSADATGLIGQDGLIGAFVDSTTGQDGLQNFYGGFWAEPPE